MAKRLLLVALCLSTLAASGCGGGTSSSGAKPGDWAADVCGAASEWATGLQADSQGVGGGQNLKSVKAKYVTFLEKSVRRSDTLLSKVKAAGPPAGKNGEALERDLERVVKAARDSLSSAVPKAKALPTTDQPTFSRKVLELSKDVGKKLTAMGQAFSRLGNPACKKLTSSG